MDGRDLLRSDVAVFRPLILMGWPDIVIVSVLALGAVVVVGVLGYLIEKKGTHEGNEDK